MSTTDKIGKFRAEVVDVKDPLKCGRIRVLCPKALGEKTISNWALPCIPPKYFSLPKIGDLVWVEFEDGDIDEPIWVGCFYTTKQWKERFKREYKTKDSIILNNE